MFDGPIASLEEPLYQPDPPLQDHDPCISTRCATFPGTDLTCWVYEGDFGTRLRERLADLTREPHESAPCTKYPGPQPLSIDRSHFSTITKQRYAIAPKTDGVRACLFITDIDGVHTATVWDRTLSTPYGVSIHLVPRVMHQVGSVLDGEIVMDRQTGQWTYVVFDCCIINGLPQYHKNLWDRLAAVSMTLDAYSYTRSDSLILKIKAFTSLHKAPLPGEEHTIESPSFPSDGYILMPVDISVVFGHHKEFFKLKTCHSVDFVYKKESLFVYNQDTKRLIKSGIPCGHPSDLQDGAIIECTLDTWHQNPAKRVWKYMTTRTDKNTSNTLFTLNKTILNMEERLTYRDIRSLAPPPSV